MTVTIAKMGRRKQNCPQKTGSTNEENANTEEETIHEEPGNEPMESDSASAVSGSSEKESVKETNETLPPLESLDPPNVSKSSSSATATNGYPSLSAIPPGLVNPFHHQQPSSASPSSEEALNILKNPLFNPALLSLNPSLYAVQLAQLQAAQLLGKSDETRKRKSEEPVLNLSAKRHSSTPESPLDLSKLPDKSPQFPPVSSYDIGTSSVNPFPFPFLNPFLAAAANTESYPGVEPKISGSSPNNPLERMSEFVKSGKSNGPRHSAWQSQWINRGPENSKDIFKCVWCKDRFSTLQDLTDHMKETKHFGSSMPPSIATPPLSSPGKNLNPSPKPPSLSPGPPKTRDILKEHLPLPRKLVRGQDVWLGRGEQQTRDILKCMWCGQSFRSLDLMTKHMQETKHYTKVISQEQLTSWKSPDTPSASPQSAVNSVLTCKVCEQSFSSLKELSDHMVKNNHYKESSKPPPASTPPASTSVISKEKRKKSLPVRKLLELERAQQEPGTVVKEENGGKITCEKCGDKISVLSFASHIHQCIGDVPPRKTPSSSPPSSRKSPNPKTNSDDLEDDEPRSILGSLEKMVANNFGTKKKGPETPTGASGSILQRLGIDESVDYSKPILDPGSYRPLSLHRNLTSPGTDSECSSPDRIYKDSPKDTRVVSPPNTGEIRFKETEEERKSSSSCHEQSPPPSISPVSTDKQPKTSEEDEQDRSEKGEKKNPLAALQMLCDKTEKPKTASRASPAPSNNGHSPSASAMMANNPLLYSGGDPGAILAFSWACNQAIVNDSLLKCPFCETPFISKGAYRHHLSKMHFVKDDGNIAKPQKTSNSGDKSPSGGSEGSESKEENATSKFQKYSRLAKQLSCSSQP